jgi:hypothetical protein
MRLSSPSKQPILDPQARHIFEISQIGRQQQRTRIQGDRADFKILCTDANTLLAEIPKSGCGIFAERSFTLRVPLAIGFANLSGLFVNLLHNWIVGEHPDDGPPIIAVGSPFLRNWRDRRATSLSKAATRSSRVGSDMVHSPVTAPASGPVGY